MRGPPFFKELVMLEIFLSSVEKRLGKHHANEMRRDAKELPKVILGTTCLAGFFVLLLKLTTN